MRTDKARGLEVAALLWLSGCGKTSADEAREPARMPADVSCTAGDRADIEAASVEEAIALPTRLAGTLCGGDDTLTVNIALDPDVTAGPLHFRLVDGASAEPHVVTIWDVDGAGKRDQLMTLPRTPEVALSAAEPELYVAVTQRPVDATVVVALTGPAGPVTLDIEQPARARPLGCSGAYESLPPSSPVRPLPAELELELCNFRDSRSFGLEVTAGREVVLTLENPLAIESFDAGFFRADTQDFVPLPASLGTTRDTLGLLGRRSLRFTPDFSGPVALYCSLGISLGETARLRVSQAEPQNP